LAYLYEHDSKIKNLNDAVDWYYKASQSGDKTAMLAVERLTREGYYPKNDLGRHYIICFSFN
jgi:TPR repeat protein